MMFPGEALVSIAMPRLTLAPPLLDRLVVHIRLFPNTLFLAGLINLVKTPAIRKMRLLCLRPSTEHIVNGE